MYTSARSGRAKQSKIEKNRSNHGGPRTYSISSGVGSNSDIDRPCYVQNNHLNRTRRVDVRCWWLWEELQINSGSGVAMDEIDIPTPF
jgi:hypothetical protein